MSGSGQSIETVTVTAQRPLETFAGPECYVDIYPFEGGSFTLNSGHLQNLSVTKTLKGRVGEFVLTLAPEFVNQNSSISWPQVITPLSTVVIGMRRGTLQAVVFVGVVTDVSTTEIWETGNPTIRTYTIRGSDMAYFLAFSDYFSLWALATLNLDASILASGWLYGDPGTIGQNWYNKIFSGGLLKSAKLQYNGGTVPTGTMFGTQFQNYDAFIPLGDYFFGINGSWFDKFESIFPFPFYEFFSTTGTSLQYPGVSDNGFQFSSQALGSNITTTPLIVARINPLPRLIGASQGNTVSFTSIDTSLWDALPSSSLRSTGFIAGLAQFDESEVYNFFVINPSWAFGLIGNTNSNLDSQLFTFGVVMDQDSINRYGYRPYMSNISWFSDPTGSFSKQHTSSDFFTTLSTLYARLAGYYDPSPLFCKVQLRTILRPDIVVGTKFTFTPFHDNEPWDFYVEGVTHEFQFGQKSSTQLNLTRGLPSSVYADPSLLFDVHTGKAQRLNGQYQTLAGATGLQGFSATSFLQQIGQWNKLYVTPQGLN